MMVTVAEREQGSRQDIGSHEDMRRRGSGMAMCHLCCFCQARIKSSDQSPGGREQRRDVVADWRVGIIRNTHAMLGTRYFMPTASKQGGLVGSTSPYQSFLRGATQVPRTSVPQEVDAFLVLCIIDTDAAAHRTLALAVVAAAEVALALFITYLVTEIGSRSPEFRWWKMPVGKHAQLSTRQVEPSSSFKEDNRQ